MVGCNDPECLFQLKWFCEVKCENSLAGAVREQSLTDRSRTRPHTCSQGQGRICPMPLAMGKELLHILGDGSFARDRSPSCQDTRGLKHPLCLPLLSEPSILSTVRAVPSPPNYFKQKPWFEAESASRHVNSQPLSRMSAAKDSWASLCPHHAPSV